MLESSGQNSTHVLVELFYHVKSRIDRQLRVQDGAPNAKLFKIEPKSPTSINIRDEDDACEEVS